MPENHMIVGKTFSAILSGNEVEEIVNKYFLKPENKVYDYRVYKLRKSGWFSVEYMVENSDKRDLLGPLLTDIEKISPQLYSVGER